MQWEEYRHPDDEYRLKTILDLRAGTFEAPARGGGRIVNVIERVRFGPGAEVLEPMSSGFLRLEGSTWIFDQSFRAGDRELRITVEHNAPSPITDTTFEIDKDRLQMERPIRGVLLDEDGEVVDYLSFASCTYSNLPLWEIEADFGGGDRALFHRRYQPPFAGSGPANVLRGEAHFGATRFVETSYWKLVYAADHHNWSEKYRIVFDAPVEIRGTPGVTALHLQEGFDEIPRAAMLLGEGFRVLLELPIVRFSEKEVPGPIPGAFRRGEATGDGRTDISDAVSVLSWLFTGGAAPWCEDAADADDSGELDISDPILLLQFLFLGSAPLPAPGAEQCGLDPTPDSLGECAGVPPGC